MSGFESEEIPDWIRDRFDERTRLPHGPLEHFPIPVEGNLTGARSSEPPDGSPAHWNLMAVCGETVAEVLRFYEEYLPLSGYEVTAAGVIRGKRRFHRGATPDAELVIFRRGQFVGRLMLEAGEPPEATRVEAEMAHEAHEVVKTFADAKHLRGAATIRWRINP